MPTPLSDAADSINDFLTEADECAASDHGFASMLCVFAVVEAISEAIAGRLLDTRRLFALFVDEMEDKTSWLHVPASTAATPRYIAGMLAETRHALVHQLSLPSGMILV